jgi:TRAP-type C4-dicarboxylate transport system permease small subunit
MTRFFMRVLGGILGLFAGVLAIVAPLNFYSNLFTTPTDAPKLSLPDGQPDFWSGIGASLIVLLLTAVLAFVSFILIRFAFTSPQAEAAEEASEVEDPQEAEKSAEFQDK